MFRQKGIFKLIQAISISSDITPTESYKQDGTTLGITIDNVRADFASNIIGVQPNPWVEKTNLKFELAADEMVEFKFYDVNGGLIYSTRGEFKKRNKQLYFITKAIYKQRCDLYPDDNIRWY